MIYRFQDLQKNCEPAAFSFEKLLINMSTDPRTPQNLLKQVNLINNYIWILLEITNID